MQFVTTSKYNIAVKRSFYAAVFVFALYCSVIISILFVFDVNWLTFPLYIVLLIIAIYSAKKAYQSKYYLIINEAGEIKVTESGKTVTGIVSASSFYNGLFIFLYLKNDPNDFSISNRNKKNKVVIYRDAVNESDYRLIARIVNFI